jgi:predicted HAD superfamily Cof-like phosphohydrolase
MPILTPIETVVEEKPVAVVAEIVEFSVAVADYEEKFGEAPDVEEILSKVSARDKEAAAHALELEAKQAEGEARRLAERAAREAREAVFERAAKVEQAEKLIARLYVTSASGIAAKAVLK